MKSSTTGTGRRATALLGVVALLLSLLAINPAPAAAAENLVTNGTFDNVDATTGLPASWTTWAPAGTTTFAVEPTAGPVGDRALRISAERERGARGQSSTGRSANQVWSVGRCPGSMP